MSWPDNREDEVSIKGLETLSKILASNLAAGGGGMRPLNNGR